MIATARPNSTRRAAPRRGMGCAGRDCRCGLAGLGAFSEADLVPQRTITTGHVLMVQTHAGIVPLPAVKVVTRVEHIGYPNSRVADTTQFYVIAPEGSPYQRLPNTMYPMSSLAYPVWPPVDATAYGRRNFAMQAFGQKRDAAAVGQVDAVAYAGGPYPPFTGEAQYTNDAAAERAWLDKVDFYTNGPLMDPTPDALFRRDRAMGGAYPVIFTNAAARQAVIDAGLRPASIPLVPVSQSLSEAVVRAAFLPPEAQSLAQVALPIAQAAIVEANQSNTGIFAAAPSGAVAAPSPMASPAAAALPATGGGNGAPNSGGFAPAAYTPASSWTTARAASTNAVASGITPAAFGDPSSTSAASDRSGVSPLVLGLCAVGLLVLLSSSGSGKSTRRGS